MPESVNKLSKDVSLVSSGRGNAVLALPGLRFLQYEFLYIPISLSLKTEIAERHQVWGHLSVTAIFRWQKTADAMSAADSVRAALAQKRYELILSHGAEHPLHSVFNRIEKFNRIENLPKPALMAVCSLHGLHLGRSRLKEGRAFLRAHVSYGKCGLHKFGYRHLGCATLLNLSSPAPSSDSWTTGHNLDPRSLHMHCVLVRGMCGASAMAATRRGGRCKVSEVADLNSRQSLRGLARMVMRSHRSACDPNVVFWLA